MELLKIENKVKMENLDKKIKLKLQTLVEGLINEAPPGGAVDDLARFIQKFGPKIKNLFGDDVALAAYRNLGDDSIRLLTSALGKRSVRRGGTFLLEGRGTILVKDVIDDIERLAANPSEYDEIVATYGDLKLSDGTYIRDFFKRKPASRPRPTVRPRPRPTPSVNVNPYETLAPVVIPQETKDAFIRMMNQKGIRISSQDLDNVMIELQKTVDQQLTKFEKTFRDPTFVKTLQAYDRLPLLEQEKMIKKVIESVKSSYGQFIFGLRVSQKTKEGLRTNFNRAVDAFFLGYRKNGKKIPMGVDFFRWWKTSIKVSLGLYAWSIYVEAVRNEDKGVWDALKFAGNKLIETPDRLFKSLIPGVNLVYSSTAAVVQTFSFVGEYITNWFTGKSDKKKPTVDQRLDSLKQKYKPKIDSLKQKYNPKIDSLKQEYQPKLDSLANKLEPQLKGLGNTDNRIPTGDPFQ